METYAAYCAACDAEVEIALGPDPDAPVAFEDVRCLERERSCGRRRCPASDLGADRLREWLEFLPPRESASPRSFDEACRIVETSRRQSLGRQVWLRVG